VSFRIRAARSADFQAIYEMAKLTGGGFTNLPADKGSLVAKLARSEDATSPHPRSEAGCTISSLSSLGHLYLCLQ
jgi:arginine N-succinyltransferase